MAQIALGYLLEASVPCGTILSAGVRLNHDTLHICSTTLSIVSFSQVNSKTMCEAVQNHTFPNVKYGTPFLTEG